MLFAAGLGLVVVSVAGMLRVISGGRAEVAGRLTAKQEAVLSDLADQWAEEIAASMEEARREWNKGDNDDNDE